MRVEAKVIVKHLGKTYKPGDVFDVDKDNAEFLIKTKSVVRTKKEPSGEMKS